MYAIYGTRNIYHQQKPQMLASIYHTTGSVMGLVMQDFANLHWWGFDPGCVEDRRRGRRCSRGTEKRVGHEYGAVHSHGAIPKMDGLIWKIPWTWTMTGGTPMTQETCICVSTPVWFVEMCGDEHSETTAILCHFDVNSRLLIGFLIPSNIFDAMSHMNPYPRSMISWWGPDSHDFTGTILIRNPNYIIPIAGLK